MIVKPSLYLAMIVWCYIFYPNHPGNDKPQVSFDSVIKSIKVCQYTDYSYQFDITLNSSFMNNTGAPISIRYPAIVARRVIRHKMTLRWQKRNTKIALIMSTSLGSEKQIKKLLLPGEKVSQTDIVTILVVKD